MVVPYNSERAGIRSLPNGTGKPYRKEYAESALPAYRIEYALLYYRSGGLAAGWPRA